VGRLHSKLTLFNTIDQDASQGLNISRTLQAVSSAGSAEHGEPAGSPTSPTAHWAAQAGGSAKQQDSDDGDYTDELVDYIDAAASVGGPASPTAHWAQPRGAAGVAGDGVAAAREDRERQKFDTAALEEYDDDSFDPGDNENLFDDQSYHEGCTLCVFAAQLTPTQLVLLPASLIMSCHWLQTACCGKRSIIMLMAT
jgi:hypothetical protein